MESKSKINRYAGFEAALRQTAERLGWGKVETEFKFNPTRKWRADFAIPSVKLLIEIEGGFWIAGRHSRGGGGEADMDKYNTAAIMGYAVLRFTPKQANNLSAMETIGEWFKEQGQWIVFGAGDVALDRQTERMRDLEDQRKEAEAHDS
jgi:very-short-patch-repair endonuclease